jgi:hypothetical protein
MILLLICAIVGIILITIFAEKGDLGWSVFIFCCFLAVVFFIDKRFSFNDLTTFVKNNSGYVISGAIVYVMVGILWSLIKWKWYCREKYEYWARNGYSMTSILATSNKARITAWMIWWPVSMSWFLLHDPITKFYNFLHRKLTHILDNISQKERTHAENFYKKR